MKGRGRENEPWRGSGGGEDMADASSKSTCSSHVEKRGEEQTQAALWRGVAARFEKNAQNREKNGNEEERIRNRTIRTKELRRQQRDAVELAPAWRGCLQLCKQWRRTRERGGECVCVSLWLAVFVYASICSVSMFISVFVCVNVCLCLCVHVIVHMCLFASVSVSVFVY